MASGYRPAAAGASLQDYDFELPDEQIATRPAEPRSSSRLLVVRAQDDVHAAFEDLGRFLRPGDLLVANNARVRPWRLEARREATGARVELLLLALPVAGVPVEAICRPARRIRAGERLDLGGGVQAEVIERHGGRCRLRLPPGAERHLAEAGHVPLPPYIVQQRRRRGEPDELALDRERYQTVYASADGAVAAPTAGLHFTAPLLDALRAQGIGWAELSLLVGPGTFEPVRVERVGEHRVAAEAYTIPASTWAAVEATRRAGGAVVAVGTTACRALESAARFEPVRLAGEADLTIVPGHRFRAVDALVTNFHLPRSSLLLLVAAFAGRERILAAYAEARDAGYRFYSYGDAMLLDRRQLG